MTTLNRRDALRFGLLAAAAMPLAACSSEGGGGDLRVSSYGDTTKLNLRKAVVKEFNATHKSGSQMSFEGTPTADYYDKLATQVSSGNAPDVINIDAARIAQYGSSNVLEPLGSYVPKTLQTATFDPVLLNQGRLNGKVYGVPVATSTYSIGYDSTMLKQFGVKIPDTWTWDDYANLALDIYHASGKKVHGSEDAGGDLSSFEIFLRTRGEALYRDDGKSAGYTAATLTEWYDYWVKLRKNGGCVPADIGAQWTYGDWTNSPIITGKAAMEHIFTPNFSGAFQAVSKHTMGMTLPPTASKGGPLGQYPGPSSLFAVNARCSNKSRAVEFVNWFVNDPKPWTMLKLISGPPASHKALAGLAKTKLSPSERLVLAYTQSAAKVAKPAPPPPPKSNTQVTDLFQRTNQDISFGKQTLAAGVSSFMSQSKSLMLQ